jgi:PKD repeat protein
MKIRLLTLLSIFLTCCTTATGAEIRTIAVDFAYSTPAEKLDQLLGYRLYKDGVQICSISNPTATSLVCTFSTEPGTFDFALTAYFSDNTESQASPGFSFSIAPSGVDDAAQLQAVIDILQNSGNVPFTVPFSANSSTGDITGYSWDFGDGSSGTGATASHTYTTAGTYTATLTVTARDGATHQASSAITALPGNISLQPPVAAISSSSGAGKAPLLVSFDASGSTTSNPPIVRYSWSFGDSSSASGIRASHSFTSPGIYLVELAVEDSSGLVDTANIPVVVSASDQPNELPEARISASHEIGVAPVTITFDGSRSSDPDGSLRLYRWDFGDGTTGSGATVLHTFTTPGNYTVTLTVADNDGGTASASKNIVSSSVLPASELNLEAGEVAVNHEWSRVLFEGTFNQPIVIAGAPTFNGKSPVQVRVRNIDSSGFDICIQEWAYLNGTHARETVSYIVMEEGTYTLDDGGRFEAGHFTGMNQFQQVTLQNTYSAMPVILTQVTTTEDPAPVTGRIQNISANSFEYRLQEQERTMLSHKPETIGYIAWEPGRGTVAGLAFEVGSSAEKVTQKWFDLQFLTSFPELPYLFPEIQTTNGRDTATLRNRDMSREAAQIKIEEEKSKDSETRHKKETVGYLVIGGAAK